jgi:uncharacterized membrane protein
MALSALTHAAPAIQIHAHAAVAALAVGGVQLALVKGDTRHRVAGYTWCALMVIVAASSFFIHELRVVGPWSPIHLLSIVTLLVLPGAVLAARAHDLRRHRRMMFILFYGALVIAGLFTLWPGRIMHQVVFGS